MAPLQQLLTLFAASLAAGSAILPHAIVPRVPEPVELGYSEGLASTQHLTSRSINKSVSFYHGVQKYPLGSVMWLGGLQDIPVGPLLTAGGNGILSASLECNDCRASGIFGFELNDEDLSNITALLTFKDFMTFVNMTIQVDGSITGMFGFGAGIPVPKAQGKFLAFDASMAVELFVTAAAKFKFQGGFVIQIPNSAITFSMRLENGTLDAEISDFPEIKAYLLPIERAGEALSITLGARFRTSFIAAAKIGNAQIRVGTFAQFVPAQLVISDTRSADPKDDCSDLINIGVSGLAAANVFADAVISSFTAGPPKPSVSTEFYSAGTSTCLRSKEPEFESTVRATLTDANAKSCPSPLTVVTTNQTSTYSFTNCLIQGQQDCQREYEQTVVASSLEEVVITKCPVDPATVTGASNTASAPSLSTPAAPVLTDLIELKRTAVHNIQTVSLVNSSKPVNKTVGGNVVALPISTRNAASGGNGTGNANGSKDDDSAAGVLLATHATAFATFLSVLVVFGFVL